ncbi:hypothetical protein H310_06673 [Aphanomyces invadans]|uniref:Uncharacterized protein n=1 Tax=Aphanomyces invadans TaxID=157072 RepID=A0A024U575_9STRA|nr:hypothetical protein H310_06673 [Aphanomyces invadans]ETW01042.1 hypothetical protein H310_06673 [Aphanomyces invadans]|eukprot:XP_008870040.1 hypothetical protein H310_06673 [Aphanomyces invadans]
MSSSTLSPSSVIALHGPKEASRAIAIHPPTGSSTSASSANLHTNTQAHSCPAPRHLMALPPHLASSSKQRSAPRTPLIGSLPDPSSTFLSAHPMPPLHLPPPPLDLDRPSSSSSSTRRETVVQFASSCPAQVGFLHMPRHAATMTAPFPASDDLSKSPSLAVMRSMESLRRERLSSHTDNRLSLDRLCLEEQDEDKEDESDDDDAANFEMDDVFVFEAQ